MTIETPVPLPATPPQWPRDVATLPAMSLPFHDLVQKNALRFSLRPELICAVCEQESAWNPWAMRFEPKFLDKYVPASIESVTERMARACSWGLMQVMGQTAREAGFGRAHLSELCLPDAGIEYGCKVLACRWAQAGGVMETALLLWNGGANKQYPSEVLARMPRYA